MRKLLVCLCIILALAGCSATNEEGKIVIENKEEVEIVANDVYTAPITSNALTNTCYNEVSDALKGSDNATLAATIAKTFAADFFTLKTKTGEDNMGGLTYFIEEKRQSAKAYLKFYYYKNYDSLVTTYGAENLPEVNGVVNADPESTTFEETDYGTLDAYSVRLNINYSDTTMPITALKTEAVITVAKYPNGWYIVEIA